MNRLFKIARRRPHIVDFYTPFTYGVDGYRLKWASNFDGSFTTILTSTNVGFIDSNVNRNVIETQPTTGKDVRIVFDPTTYSIPDVNSFWLKFVPVTGGVEGTAGAPTLVLPDSVNKGVGMVTIQGNAPSGTDSTGSLQLDLPFLMRDFRIHNQDGTNNLYVSMEQSGPEVQCQPDKSAQLTSFNATQASLWVRGGGAIVSFSATFTLAFPS